MEYIELKRKAFAVEHKQTRVQRHHEVPEKSPQEREAPSKDGKRKSGNKPIGVAIVKLAPSRGWGNPKPGF